MYRQRGAACLDEGGMLRSGVLIRHLLLPGQLGGALDVMDWVGSTFPKGSVLFSLMSQYTPMPGLEEKYPELCRAVTAEEYDGAMSYLPLAGLERGFVQERSAATVAEIPDFDGTGVHDQNEFRGKE